MHIIHLSFVLFTMSTLVSHVVYWDSRMNLTLSKFLVSALATLKVSYSKFIFFWDTDLAYL